MSRFIRTKDGIFEIRTISDEPIIDFDGKPDYEDTRAVYTTTDERHTYYYGEDVIKEADTIDELIDGYIFVSKSGETHYVYFKEYDMGVCLGCRIESDKEFKKHLLEKGNVYGAIWTDKGLIYVAKMNEKGDLELI